MYIIYMCNLPIQHYPLLQVRQWRERKLELLQLEQQVAQRRHAEMVEQMKEEEEREKKKREKDRLKVRGDRKVKVCEKVKSVIRANSRSE